MTRTVATWLMVFSMLLGAVVPNVHASVCVAPDDAADPAERTSEMSGENCCEVEAERSCCDSTGESGCSESSDEPGDEPCSDHGCDCPASCCVQLTPGASALPIAPGAVDMTVSSRAAEIAPLLAAHGYHQDIVWPPIA